MTSSISRSWISRLAVVAIASCSSTGPRPPARVPSPDACIGTPVAARPPLHVDGYPVPAPFADKAARDARTAELERKVPGWKLVLDDSGLPATATLATAGAPVSELATRVTELLDRLAPVYQFSTQPTLQVANDSVFVRNSIGDTSIGLRYEPSQIVVSATRGHRFELPPGAHEITDSELFVRWGGYPRKLQVTVPPEFHPCDPAPGYPNACSTPDARVECMAVWPLTGRADIEAAGRFRRVIYVDIPSISGCNSRQRDAAFTTASYCTVSSPVPRCMDAITGETLADDCTGP